MSLLKIMLATGMLVLAAGCASEEIFIEPPSASTLGETNYEQSPALNRTTGSQNQVPEIIISDTLAFSVALSKALLENPDLQSFGWQVRIAEAERLQSALPPNPELEAEMENFSGSGPFEGYDAREITVSLAQQVLLGADRMKSKRVASLNRELAGWDYETRRLEVLTGVTQAYISALEAQQQWLQQQELLQVAEQFLETVSAQVEAGKVPGLAQIRAQVELSNAQIDVNNALRRFETARSNLASFWGSSQPIFEVLEGTLSVPADELPSYQTVTGYIEHNPDVARWATEISQREAVLSLERATGIPDITLRGGYKRAEDIGAGAAMVGVSIPLPVFDRNQGAIRAARYELNRVHTQELTATSEAYRALQEAYNTLEGSYYEVLQLQDEVLPGAETAFEAAQTGYQQGKFDYLEVLDAQRTFFSSRTRFIQALAEYHRAFAEVERLIGTPLSEISSN